MDASDDVTTLPTGVESGTADMDTDVDDDAPTTVAVPTKRKRSRVPRPTSSGSVITRSKRILLIKKHSEALKKVYNLFDTQFSDWLQQELESLAQTSSSSSSEIEVSKPKRSRKSPPKKPSPTPEGKN